MRITRIEIIEVFTLAWSVQKTVTAAEAHPSMHGLHALRQEPNRHDPSPMIPVAGFVTRATNCPASAGGARGFPDVGFTRYLPPMRRRVDPAPGVLGRPEIPPLKSHVVPSALSRRCRPRTYRCGTGISANSPISTQSRTWGDEGLNHGREGRRGLDKSRGCDDAGRAKFRPLVAARPDAGAFPRAPNRRVRPRLC
jgi:hypothetical protein